MKENLIWLAVLSITLDRIITVMFWGYESNPITIELGLYWWLILTYILIIAMASIWFYFGLWLNRCNRLLTWFLIVIHVFAFISNSLIVLYG